MRRRIAIIGAGISGLAAADLLAQVHDVTVFEANDYAGGHTRTVEVPTEQATHHVDTGFIVFNDRNYPNFERLLGRLGVSSQPTSNSFSVSDGNGDFEYSSASVNGIFAKRSHMVTPSFYRMVGDLVRFQREALGLLGDPEWGPGLGAWLEQQRYSRPFIDHLVIPLVSAVWSTDPEQVLRFPARFLVEFFENHGMLALRHRPSWRTVVGGSSQYVKALTRPLGSRLLLSAPIRSVHRHEDHILVTPAGAEPLRFDEVVLACHSDQALALLADSDALEREVLGSIRYRANNVVLHTDVRMMPKRRRAWASWNYHLATRPSGNPTVTYYMNRLQSLTADRDFLVTLNRTAEIDPAAVISATSFSHPVFTPEADAAKSRHREMSGRRHTHFCGAYWGAGFHEDGVVSALRVAERLGAGGR